MSIPKALSLSILSTVLAIGAALQVASSAHANNTFQPSSVSSHQTAATQYIVVDGARLAYRRYGNRGSVPLVFFQHFVGNLDSWDPKITDGFADTREVVIFDNAGVASSEGEVPTTVEGMAKYGIDFIEALGIKKADLLGFSLGSLVAQQVAIERPDLVRRLILVGSGPRGGKGMASLTPEFQGMLAKKHEVADELLLDVFFTPSENSQAAGRRFLKRLRARTVNRDIEVNDKVVPAQVAAFAAWGAPSVDSNRYLKRLKAPTMVVSGSKDLVHYTVNSFTLQQNSPDAQLIIYPDSAHGSIYQYPELFLQQAAQFLK
jgi:pimeloyl-ACP methyl ester carboxylesterase